MRGEKEEEVCEGEVAREPHLPEGVTETPCGLPWLKFCLQRAAAASTARCPPRLPKSLLGRGCGSCEVTQL